MNTKGPLPMTLNDIASQAKMLAQFLGTVRGFVSTESKAIAIHRIRSQPASELQRKTSRSIALKQGIVPRTCSDFSNRSVDTMKFLAYVASSRRRTV